ncbi:hypothetical protein Acr_00g0066140 [Actinidia rufa]|uniref:CCHC-type domain-containing protein n=1 Tax=Actinidia rufa TaxID=165716 RepID=A0A7J0DQ03_9ERIC|nr:hypothetical protein Acr_00g0066140 [Actinidia rufa]
MTVADYEGSFTNLAEYAPHLVATDEMRARRFEDGLRHEIRRAIRPLVLPTYADVLDRAIIVEKNEIERKKYFDSKRRQNFGFEGTSGQKKIEVRNEIRCVHCNEVEHIKRNCPRLRTEAVTPRGGNVNNQRQGQAFALMSGDARNTEDIVCIEIVVSALMRQ